MPYRLIEGEVRLFYHSTRLVGSRPDGDSVWFKPENEDLLKDIGFRDAKVNKGDFAMLRLEGIDALELHYKGANHQLEDPTVAARDFLLDVAGFHLAQIEYAPSDHIPVAPLRHDDGPVGPGAILGSDGRPSWANGHEQNGAL